LLLPVSGPGYTDVAVGWLTTCCGAGYGLLGGLVTTGVSTCSVGDAQAAASIVNKTITIKCFLDMFFSYIRIFFNY
jgi:hypothetical protein